PQRLAGGGEVAQLSRLRERLQVRKPQIVWIFGVHDHPSPTSHPPTFILLETRRSPRYDDGRRLGLKRRVLLGGFEEENLHADLGGWQVTHLDRPLLPGFQVIWGKLNEWQPPGDQARG